MGLYRTDSTDISQLILDQIVRWDGTEQTVYMLMRDKRAYTGTMPETTFDIDVDGIIKAEPITTVINENGQDVQYYLGNKLTITGAIDDRYINLRQEWTDTHERPNWLNFGFRIKDVRPAIKLQWGNWENNVPKPNGNSMSNIQIPFMDRYDLFFMDSDETTVLSLDQLSWDTTKVELEQQDNGCITISPITWDSTPIYKKGDPDLLPVTVVPFLPSSGFFSADQVDKSTYIPSDVPIQWSEDTLPLEVYYLFKPDSYRNAPLKDTETITVECGNGTATTTPLYTTIEQNGETYEVLRGVKLSIDKMADAREIDIRIEGKDWRGNNRSYSNWLNLKYTGLVAESVYRNGNPITYMYSGNYNQVLTFSAGNGNLEIFRFADKAFNPTSVTSSNTDIVTVEKNGDKIDDYEIYHIRSKNVGSAYLNVEFDGKTYQLPVEVILPDVGFYTTDTADKSTFISRDNAMQWSEDSLPLEVYYLFRPDSYRDAPVKDTEKITVECGDNEVTVTPLYTKIEQNGMTYEVLRGIKITADELAGAVEVYAYIEGQNWQGNNRGYSSWIPLKYMGLVAEGIRKTGDPATYTLTGYYTQALDYSYGSGSYQVFRFADKPINPTAVTSSNPDIVTVEKIADKIADQDIYNIRSKNIGSAYLNVEFDGKTYQFPIEVTLPMSGFYTDDYVDNSTFLTNVNPIQWSPDTLPIEFYFLLSPDAVRDYPVKGTEKIEAKLGGNATGKITTTPLYTKFEQDGKTFEVIRGFKITITEMSDARYINVRIEGSNWQNFTRSFGNSIDLKYTGLETERINIQGNPSVFSHSGYYSQKLTYTHAVSYMEIFRLANKSINPTSVTSADESIVTVQKQSVQIDGIDMYRIRANNVGSTYLNVEVDGKTYQLPVEINLPTNGFYSEDLVDNSTFIPYDGFIQWSEDTLPLEVYYLLKPDAVHNFPVKGTEKIEANCDGKNVTVTPLYTKFERDGKTYEVLRGVKLTAADVANARSISVRIEGKNWQDSNRNFVNSIQLKYMGLVTQQIIFGGNPPSYTASGRVNSYLTYPCGTGNWQVFGLADALISPESVISADSSIVTVEKVDSQIDGKDIYLIRSHKMGSTHLEVVVDGQTYEFPIEVVLPASAFYETDKLTSDSLPLNVKTWNGEPFTVYVIMDQPLTVEPTTLSLETENVTAEIDSALIDGKTNGIVGYAITVTNCTADGYVRLNCSYDGSNGGPRYDRPAYLTVNCAVAPKVPQELNLIGDAYTADVLLVQTKGSDNVWKANSWVAMSSETGEKYLATIFPDVCDIRFKLTDTAKYTLTTSFPSDSDVYVDDEGFTVVRMDKADKVYYLQLNARKTEVGSTYAINGTVTKDTAEPDQYVPVEGTIVKLRRGQKVLATTTTNADGKYTFNALPAGDYNVVVTTSDDQTMTQFVKITNRSEVVDVRLPYANVSAVVNVKDTSSDILVGGLDAVVNEHQQGQTNVTVQFVVEDKKESDIPVVEAAEIKAAAGTQTVEFFDMAVEHYVEDNKMPNITDTGSALEIVISFETSNRKNIKVYRHHDNEPTVMRRLEVRPTTGFEDGTYYVGDGFIVIYASKYSTYAIGYEPDEQPDSETIENMYMLLMLLYNRTFDIEATATEGGAVVTDGESIVKYSKDKTYTIVPDEGYQIVSVVVDGEDMGAITEYTFTKVKEKHTIHAVFEKAPWQNPFEDVTEDDWFYDDVAFVHENSVMLGVTESEFGPEIVLNRATLVTTLWRLAGSPVVELDAEFDDLSDDLHTDAMKWAISKEIIRGYGDDTCKPMQEVTHEQVVAILHRFMLSMGHEDTLDTVSTELVFNEWAKNDVIWAVANNLFERFGSDISDLTETADRAEIAAYLHEICELIEE